jgi:hypothetical protein
MKPSAFTAILLLLTSLYAYSQFTLLPQIGLERAKTTIEQNDLFQFSPLGSKSNFRINLRADYKFKGGHGPYIGVGTAPSVVQVEFNDPVNAYKTAMASTAELNWRFEAGYQYSFKPLNISKPSMGNNQVEQKSQASKKSCGSYQYKSACGTKKSQPSKVSQATTMRIQPSMGLAYIPSVNEAMSVSNNNYKYMAAHSGFALVPAIGFEFGKGKQRIMNVSVQYAKSLGKQDEETVSAISNGKNEITRFSTNTSSWNLSVGIPFTLKKQSSTVKQKQQQQKKSCQQQVYRYKCVKKI